VSSRKSVWDSIIASLDPVHSDGYKFIAIAGLVTIVFFLLWAPLGLLGLFATAAIAYFFRDPQRATPVGDGLLIAPADGRLIALRHMRPAADLGLGEPHRTTMSTFLSVFDVHIVRAPVSGRIILSSHQPGLFINAESDDASEHNERQSVVIRTAQNADIAVILIAGLVARRIVMFISDGDTVRAGQRIGLIRFGSRVDVILPSGCRQLVAEGQRMVGGETVLADLNSPAEVREVRIT
jgi:phosphatidylserine decarboxylase